MRYFANRSFLMGTFDILITDENGAECFSLLNQGKIGYNYGLYDQDKRKLGNVKQHIAFSFKNRFDVDLNGREVQIVFSHRFKINGEAYCKFTGLDWRTEGDLHHHDYSVLDGNKVMARVRLTGTVEQDKRDPFKVVANEMNRSLEIECADDGDAALILAVVFAIELAEKCDGSRYSG